jgi:O-antigen/teichoic acid export membrane protein
VTLFLPLVIFLLVYGTELLRRWVNLEFATACGPLLPVISLTTMFAVAGQFNSTSMLYGLSRHDRMARGLLLEALLSIGGIWLVLPHYGILGVAWVVGMLSVLNRGLYVPWLVCRALDSSFPGYMWGIYARPWLTGIPVLLLIHGVKAAGGAALPCLVGSGQVHLGAQNGQHDKEQEDGKDDFHQRLPIQYRMRVRMVPGTNSSWRRMDTVSARTEASISITT